MENNESIKKIQKRSIINRLLAVIAILLIGAAGYGTYYFYNKYNDLKSNPDVVTQQEATVVKSKVGKLILLPTDEEPTIATVLDKDKLKDQDFFKNAENGDKLLAYVNAKKAILYRPSTNMIIEVAPIYINTQEAQKDAIIEESE